MPKCDFCGEYFPKGGHGARFCSVRCRKSSNRQHHDMFSDKSGIPPGTVGAIHELLVCVKLMQLEYHVFRSQSPNSPCDLIAMKDDNLYRIEVTTGYKRENGSSVYYPKHKEHTYSYDYIAVVLNDGTINWYDKNHISCNLDNIGNL